MSTRTDTSAITLARRSRDTSSAFRVDAGATEALAAIFSPSNRDALRGADADTAISGETPGCLHRTAQHARRSIGIAPYTGPRRGRRSNGVQVHVPQPTALFS